MKGVQWSAVVSFLGSQSVDDERMRPVAELSGFDVNAWSFLQCFVTVGWVTGRTFGL